MNYLILAGKFFTNYFFENLVLHGGITSIYIYKNSCEIENGLLLASKKYQEFLETVTKYRDNNINDFALHNPIDHFIEIYEYAENLLSQKNYYDISYSILIHGLALLIPDIGIFDLNTNNLVFLLYENLHTGMHLQEIHSSSYKIDILDIPKFPSNKIENYVLNYFFSNTNNLHLHSQCDYLLSPKSLPSSKLTISGMEFNLLIIDFNVKNKLPISINDTQGLEFHNITLLGVNSLEVRVFSHNWHSEEPKTFILYDFNIDFSNALDMMLLAPMIDSINFCY